MVKTPKASPISPKRYHTGVDIPMRVIRSYARAIAEQFHPDKIILFGSRASGTPHQDSDVDILVVMPARNQIDQALLIDRAIDPPFPMDLIVPTPRNLKLWLDENESFHTEIVSKGKVLYEASDESLDTQSRRRSRNGRAGSSKRDPGS